MIEQEVIVAERNAALGPRRSSCRTCRELLAMLMSDPSPAYAEISARLGMAVGSIGPTGPAAWNGCAVHRTWSPSPAIRPGMTSRLRSQGVSKVTKGWDDEEVLAALQQALHAQRAVPPEFIEAGKNAFAWHNIDAELAQLTYDSTLDSGRELSLRAEAASIRALTFTSAHLTIELEVAQDSLLGQIIPAQPATIKIQPRQGTETALATDEIGCFSIQPIPSGPFRMHCDTAAGVDALTGWITL